MRKFFKKCQNLEYGIFDGVGKYGMPMLKPLAKEDFDINTPWLQFHKAVTVKNDRERYGVDFFIDDYQFERVWTSVGVYTEMLKQFKYVMTPDFSLYLDMPKAMQIYNLFRNRWLGAYWQSQGIKVLPAFTWSDRESFNWCFDGMPKNSVIAISSVGLLKDEGFKRNFLRGYEEMRNRLDPSLVVFYGRIPKEIKDTNVVYIPPFYEETKQRCKLQKNIKKAFKNGGK